MAGEVQSNKRHLTYGHLVNFTLFMVEWKFVQGKCDMISGALAVESGAVRETPDIKAGNTLNDLTRSTVTVRSKLTYRIHPLCFPRVISALTS